MDENAQRGKRLSPLPPPPNDPHPFTPSSAYTHLWPTYPGHSQQVLLPVIPLGRQRAGSDPRVSWLAQQRGVNRTSSLLQVWDSLGEAVLQSEHWGWDVSQSIPCKPQARAPWPHPKPPTITTTPPATSISPPSAPQIPRAWASASLAWGLERIWA